MRGLARPLGMPATLGEWLAAYRLRRGQETSSAISPETLGRGLGVSGSTIRRWESGLAKPTSEDLQRFGEVCALTQLELVFLEMAHSLAPSERALPEASFRSHISTVLNSPYPTLIFDSLFFARAWNNAVNILREPPAEPPMRHVLAAPLMGASPTEQDRLNREDRIRRWLRDFWLSTAPLLGTEPFKELIKQLSGLDGFSEQWLSLARGRQTSDLAVGTPYYFSNSAIGTFRVYPVRLVLPPVYHLREFVPIDDLARGRLLTFRESTAQQFVFAAESHWSTSPGAVYLEQSKIRWNFESDD